MPTTIPPQIDDSVTNLEKAAASTHPQFPTQGDHGGIISGESSKETFDLIPLEQQIIALTVEGCTGEEKAGIIGIDEQSLDAHLQTIFAKLGVSCEFELILFAIHHRLVATYDICEGGVMPSSS